MFSSAHIYNGFMCCLMCTVVCYQRGSGVTEVVSEVSESEDEREEKAEIQRMSATLRRLIEQDKITSKSVASFL